MLSMKSPREITGRMARGTPWGRLLGERVGTVQREGERVHTRRKSDDFRYGARLPGILGIP